MHVIILWPWRAVPRFNNIHLPQFIQKSPSSQSAFSGPWAPLHIDLLCELRNDDFLFLDAQVTADDFVGFVSSLLECESKLRSLGISDWSTGCDYASCDTAPVSASEWIRSRMF